MESLEILNQPLTKQEVYLNSIYTGDLIDLPEPKTREEVYLEAIAKKPIGVSKPLVFIINYSDWTSELETYVFNIRHNKRSLDLVWSIYEELNGKFCSSVGNIEITDIDNIKVICNKRPTKTKLVISPIY